jgi:plastocyanin
MDMYRKILLISAIFLLFYSIGLVELKANAQGNTLTFTINPGATASDSQNPIVPRNVTVPVGTKVIWLNKDSSPHTIVSGTPDKGPSNIFYGDSFDTDKTYNITLNTPGVYGYYDPAWAHISGQITVVAGNNPVSTNVIQPQQNNNNIATQQSSSSSSSNNNNIVSQQSNNIATQQSNSNPNTQQGSIPIGNNFILSGPLSSFLSTPSGNWVVNGTWILKVQNGALSFFTGNMQWDPTNLTKVPHSHNFANFRADPNTQSISLGSDRITDIKGIMDIGANNKIEWINVPAEIKTAGNTITVSILDDSKTGNHFNNYPIFGKIAHIEKCSDNGGFGANMDFDPSIGKCSL